MFGADFHDLLHWVAHLMGHQIGEDLPFWMHPVLHIVLVGTPVAFLILVLVKIVAWLVFMLRSLRARAPAIRLPSRGITGFESTIYRYILRHSGRQQLFLIALGLASMPLLYATLELPKIIINNAIDSDHFPVLLLGQPLGQIEYLFALCALYLTAILATGAMKYTLNVHKGRVGERLLRRMRLSIYRRWRGGAGSARRSEVIPIMAQEVEPIGGFAADAFALPVFQGGTFITILLFMFLQDPILGAAALTLLPVQLALIPRLQRRVNSLARARVAEMRNLGGELGDQASGSGRDGGLISVGRSLKRIQSIRQDIHRAKFFMKSLTNFLSALTPFFFYSVGGYLVIDGRLSLGALVAVLAAYKDFSAPLRELFRYYQSAEDVRIRYAEVLNFIAARAEAGQGSKPDHPRLHVALAPECIVAVR